MHGSTDYGKDNEFSIKYIQMGKLNNMKINSHMVQNKAYHKNIKLKDKEIPTQNL